MKVYQITSVCTVFILSLFSLYGCAGGQAKKTESNTAESVIAEQVEQIGDISGPMQVNGLFKNPNSVNGKLIKLYETEGKDRFIVDSAIVTDGRFTFDLADVSIGMFRIGISDVERTQGTIILNPEEQSIDIQFASASMISGLTFPNSTENKAWLEHVKLDRVFDKEIKVINKEKVDLDTKRSNIYARRIKLDEAQDELADKYPMTFAAKVARALQSPHVKDRDQYWDDIDFTDESLIHSQVFNDRLMTYMQVHAREENQKGDGKTGFYNSVDRIANIVKERGSDGVLEFVLYTMSESFYKSGHADISHYIIDNYFYGDSCGDSEITELFRMKAAGLKSLDIGNKPPDFVAPDVNGKDIRLSDVIKDNEYTLVFFWASFCHKCEEEIPVIKSFYPEYHKKGFEILGVSIDYSKKSWMDGIKANDHPWLNVSDLASWGGPILKKYRVTKSPVMFLLDKEGKIVLRPETAVQIRAYLKKNLN